jgi:hypothetical protein
MNDNLTGVFPLPNPFIFHANRTKKPSDFYAL